ncbi:MAG: hypothetical protein IKK33_12810 [Lachnospiraceae bacterium]|nr:hypothetical protein [Lachnospiraceae bacterium]
MKYLLYNYFIRLEYLENLVKRLIYIGCFICFCYFDQIVGSANGYIQNGYRNYIPVLLCVITLTSYKVKDFLKVKYLIWCLIYILSCFLTYDWIFEQVDNKISLKANLLLVGIVILICIRMYEYYFKEKNKLYINWTTLIVFAIMTVLMMVFRLDLVWTVTLLFVCLLLYFTDFKETGLNNLFSGMLDGIIIGFFLIQVQAWMYRPYDILRYHGMYSHPNMNALFYLCVLVALLSKWYMLRVNHKSLFLCIPYIILSGIVISTMFYTGARSAFVTFLVLTAVFLLFQMFIDSTWRLLKALISGFVLFVSVVICMLPSYWMIRYIPVYFNNPLYFEADMAQMHKKVQKNEDIHSDKYIELSEAVDVMFERYLWFLDTETAEYIEGFIRDFPESFNITIQADAATLDTMIGKQVAPGTDKEHPLVLSGENGEGVYNVRIDIYKYFWDKVGLVGDKNNPTGVWTSKWNYAGHTHNLFLQIAYDFGIIVGVIFILLIVMIYIRIIIGLVKERSPDNYFRLFVATMYITLFVVFGMFEIDWRYGQLSFTMFFVVQYVIHHKMPEPEAVAETAPVEVGQYVVPGKGGFKELVVVDLDAEEE